MRQYLSIDEIQKQVLPLSKKKIRVLIKAYLPFKRLENCIYVERSELERFLKEYP